MLQELELKISPDKIDDIEFLKKSVAQKLNISNEDVQDLQIIKKSIDARKKRPFFLLKVKVGINENINIATYKLNINKVAKGKKIIIIGAGPAGYFAAIQCLALGLKPIVLERGKDVQARRKDLRAIQKFDEVNPHSNYCFGEGGAGTYSDGKLYTRSHKRGSIEEILNMLVFYGANPNILIDAHPHIGSNKLPKIIANIRESIESLGGEIIFNSFMTDILIKDNEFQGVLCENGKEYFGDALILATGHSARDVFSLLHEKKILIEAKDFALGVRIEHPQSLIDEIQYNQKKREENLPAASYKLVCQVQNQGVFSFCMCPGGLIVPAATSPGEIVVNGMSPSRRNSRFANSGFVTSIQTKDLNRKGYSGVFSNLNFQKEVEQKLFNHGDGSQKAPTLRMTDFVNKKLSSSLNESSYIPGVYPAPLYDLLPSFIFDKLSQGLLEIAKKMKPFYTEEANVVGIESRTSSPTRIPRDTKTLMHTEIKGLFPCGEGAGYAGGILSAAMDGQNVAKAINNYLS